jgi:septum site-determining protein MinD
MICAVTSGKGGVGKSTVSLELAALLAAPVVDADLTMADLCLDTHTTLHDVLCANCSPFDALHRMAGDILILPGGKTLAGARAADISRIKPTLEALEQTFGTIIIDCPAGLAVDAGLPLAVADVCLIIASPESYALRDAIKIRELAETLQSGIAGIIINQCHHEPDTDFYRNILQAPIHTLPYEPQLKETLSTLTPLCHRNTAHPIADRLSRLAHELIRADAETH